MRKIELKLGSKLGGAWEIGSDEEKEKKVGKEMTKNNPIRLFKGEKDPSCNAGWRKQGQQLVSLKRENNVGRVTPFALGVGKIKWCVPDDRELMESGVSLRGVRAEG